MQTFLKTMVLSFFTATYMQSNISRERGSTGPFLLEKQVVSISKWTDEFTGGKIKRKSKVKEKGRVGVKNKYP